MKNADEYKPHDPERFEKYYELKDKSGFRIDHCDYIFKFDKYGGWRDEYHNYYNADGEPDQEPDYSDSGDEPKLIDEWSEDEIDDDD